MFSLKELERFNANYQDFVTQFKDKLSELEIKVDNNSSELNSLKKDITDQNQLLSEILDKLPTPEQLENVKQLGTIEEFEESLQGGFGLWAY